MLEISRRQMSWKHFWSLMLFLLFCAARTMADDCTLPLFSPPLHFSNGATTVRVTVADFNNDGIPDVAATAHDSSFVGIFIGDGTGNFVRQTVLSAGNFSVPVSAGDFNNDGKQDLAVGSRDGTVWIYLGNGDGTFSAPTRYVDGSGEAYEIAVADFNQDGKLDLAIGHQFGGLAIMIGDGNGGFSLTNTYLSGLGPVLVQKADFNNDGKTDLITANAQGGNDSILLGDGAGGFSVSTAPFPLSAFALGDFNKDGNTDVFTSGTDGVSLLLHLGDGHGGFTSGPRVYTGIVGGLATADFNGDGNLDIAAVNGSTNQMAVILGDGAGNFGNPGISATGNGSGNPMAADFNNDGRPDVVTANYYGLDITVMLNNGSTQDTLAPVISSAPDIVTDATSPTGANVTYSIIALDNSGATPTLDCSIPSNSLFAIGVTGVTCSAADACGNRSASVSFNVSVIDQPPILSLPNGVTATATVSTGAVVNYTATANDVVSGALPVFCNPASGSTFPIGQTAVTCSATDGGGHTSTGSFDVRVFDCIGCTLPTFEAPRIFNLGSAGYGAGIASGDFNNDGKLDVAYSYGQGDQPGGIAVMFGDGAGNFGAPITNDNPFPGAVYSPVAGDFNSDGKLDVAALIDGCECLVVFFGDGAGHFTVTVYGTDSSPRYASLAVGDMNKDGKTDIVVTVQDNIDVFLQDGLGGFSLFSLDVGYFSSQPQTGVIADFNGDGNPDFAVGSFGGVALFFGNGTGALTQGGAVPGTPDSPGSLASADLNGDGKLDMVSSDYFVALGDGGGGFSDAVYYPGGVANCVWIQCANSPGLDRASVRIADINGDGKSDLVSARGLRLGDGNGNFGISIDLPDNYTPYDVTVGDFNGDGKPDILTLAWIENTKHLSLFLNTTYQTPVGANSTVIVNKTTFTFDDVTTGGTTTVTPIDPALVGQVPGGFSVSDSVAYEIATTATFTGSVTLAFKVPGPISQADFNNLAILHNVNGTLVDVTASTPPRNYTNLTIYATTTSFSPFYLARKGTHINMLFDQTKAYKRGSTIPIKLQVLNASNANVSSSGTSLTTRDLRLISGNTLAPIEDAGNANPDYTFRYDSTLGGAGGGYIFNLSTKGLASGQYVLSFYVGSERSFFYTVKFEVK